MLTLSQALTIWSFRRELTYVVLAFCGVLLIPVVAVTVLTQTGLNYVSDKLAVENTESNVVEILNPGTGEVLTTIESEMAWPLVGTVTLEFGVPHLPYQVTHTGIDIATKEGDPIHPFMGGTVIYARELSWGYGKHVIIDHGNSVKSLYGHLDKIFAYEGQTVEITDTIGNEGSTGWSTGDHLHFQITVFDVPVNPRVFLE